MNFEEAEIVLYAIEIMYEANLKRLNEVDAQRIRRESLVSLGDAFRAVNREEASPFTIADQIRPRKCRGCGLSKPQFVFRWRVNQTFSDKCMDCEAEENWKREKQELATSSR